MEGLFGHLGSETTKRLAGFVAAEQGHKALDLLTEAFCALDSLRLSLDSLPARDRVYLLGALEDRQAVLAVAISNLKAL